MSILTEDIFDAIQVLIDSNQNNQYDKTIVATIVQRVTDKKYLVDTGSLKFHAFTSQNNITYKANQKVYILIPEGNYDNHKIITGIYENDNNEDAPIEYKASTSHIIDITDNFVNTDITGELTIRADAKETSLHLVTINMNEKGPFNYGLKDTDNFDYIGIKAKFKVTGLDITNTTGSYGLYFKMTMADGQSYDYILDSSQMIGNPYMFVGDFYTQEITYTCAAGVPINLECYFYQDGNFTALLGNENIIQVKNIKYFLGYSEDNFAGQNDIVKIYLSKGDSYYNDLNST